MLACLIAVASIAVACGNDQPETPEPAATPVEPGAPAPAPGLAPPAAAIPPAPPGDEAAAGDAVVTEGTLPEGFPKDVPIYPGVNVLTSITTSDGIFSTFDTDDEVDPILTYYRSELAKNGWSVVDSAPGDGLDGTKGNRTVKMQARKNEENRTEIGIKVGTAGT